MAVVALPMCEFAWITLSEEPDNLDCSWQEYDIL